jgi:AcrR family transcriptional regulator
VPATTRDRLIASAAETFMRRGLAASGLKEIAAASEATIGSLYHFFPGGKDELAAEALRTAGGAYQAIVEAFFHAAPDLVTAVETAFEGAAETLRATGYADACPIATVALEVASSDEHLRLVTAEIFEGWTVALEGHLEAAGVLPHRARQVGTTILAALEGGFLLSRAAQSTEPMLSIGRTMTELVAQELAARPA